MNTRRRSVRLRKYGTWHSCSCAYERAVKKLAHIFGHVQEMLCQVKSYSVVKVHGAFLSPKSLNEPLSVHLFTRIVYIFAVKSQLICDNFPEIFFSRGWGQSKGAFFGKRKTAIRDKNRCFPQ